MFNELILLTFTSLSRYFMDLNLDEDQSTSCNKSVEDNYNSIHWTKKRTRELGHVYSGSHVKMQCQSGSGNSLPGDWSRLPQPQLKNLFETVDHCKNTIEENKSTINEFASTEEETDFSDEELSTQELRDKRFQLNSFQVKVAMNTIRLILFAAG